MKPLVLALAVLTSAAGTPRAADYDMRLTVTRLDGAVLVHPPAGDPYSIVGPDAGGAFKLLPGSVVQVTAGSAAFDSDLHAKLFAPQGAIFTFTVADPEGRSGLRVRALSETAPLAMEIGGARLSLSRGGGVAVYDAGCVQVERPSVLMDRGTVLREGESLQVALYGRPGPGLTPGDTLTLDVPRRASFAPSVARFARPEMERPLELAANPFDFDPADVTLRNALGAEPGLPPQSPRDPGRCAH
jgi:hypothetical protein